MTRETLLYSLFLFKVLKRVNIIFFMETYGLCCSKYIYFRFFFLFSIFIQLQLVFLSVYISYNPLRFAKNTFTLFKCPSLAEKKIISNTHFFLAFCIVTFEQLTQFKYLLHIFGKMLVMHKMPTVKNSLSVLILSENLKKRCFFRLSVAIGF